MKRYAQRCPVARALDVIGERWTPLIVRELLLGPKRYTDLLEALPGVGTNVLAGRLSDLQAHGVVVKRTLPPPTPVAVYELTEAGRALGPVIGELRAWGERFGPPPKAGDAVRSSWIVQSAARREPGLEDGQVCSLHVGDEVFELRGARGEVTVRAGTSSAPDAVVKIGPKALGGLATGRIAAIRAREEAEVEGDWGVAADVIEMLAGSAK